MRVLVTGGAGFIGSHVSLTLAERHPDWTVIALDNLRRRGSELNLPRLSRAGVHFVHGDVRMLADLLACPEADAVVECSAEPSAFAGQNDTSYVVHSNLVGAYNCFELARRDGAQVVFLSTSRVYSIDALSRLRYAEGPSRYELATEQSVSGASSEGIAETFPTSSARTLYGATKLAAELLLAEYAAAFDLPVVVNRCGVVAGPWQMGRCATSWMFATS